MRLDFAWFASMLVAIALAHLDACGQQPKGLPGLLEQIQGDGAGQQAQDDSETPRDARHPVPSTADLRLATEGIRVIFDSDAAKARTPKDKTTLAQTIFEKRDAAKNPNDRYALLMTALEFAAEGEDAALMLRVADQTAQEFAVDRVSLISSRIGELSGPVNPSAWPAISRRLQVIATECLEQGRFDDAGQIINAFTAMAKRAKDAQATNAAVALRKGLMEKKRAAAKLAELAEAANAPGADPKKMTEYGRFLCFSQGDWGTGLPQLCKGDDATLRDLAQNESRARSIQQRIAAAEGWVQYAEKASLNEREPARDHAVSLLTSLLPKLDGLTKLRVEKIIDDVLMSSTNAGKETGSWIVIFRSSDPRIWDTDSAQHAVNYAVPLAGVPATIKYLRVKRASGAAVIIPITKNMLDKCSQAGRFRFQGAKAVSYSASLLGIVDAEAEVGGQQGQVAVGVAPKSLSGWGFGVVILGGVQGACWGGKPIPSEPLEIAVLSRGLTPEERKFLLE